MDSSGSRVWRRPCRFHWHAQSPGSVLQVRPRACVMRLRLGSGIGRTASSAFPSVLGEHAVKVGGHPRLSRLVAPAAAFPCTCSPRTGVRLPSSPSTTAIVQLLPDVFSPRSAIVRPVALVHCIRSEACLWVSSGDQSPLSLLGGDCRAAAIVTQSAGSVRRPQARRMFQPVSALGAALVGQIQSRRGAVLCATGSDFPPLLAFGPASLHGLWAASAWRYLARGVACCTTCSALYAVEAPAYRRHSCCHPARQRTWVGLAAATPLAATGTAHSSVCAFTGSSASARCVTHVPSVSVMTWHVFASVSSGVIFPRLRNPVPCLSPVFSGYHCSCALPAAAHEQVSDLCVSLCDVIACRPWPWRWLLLALVIAAQQQAASSPFCRGSHPGSGSFRPPAFPHSCAGGGTACGLHATGNASSAGTHMAQLRLLSYAGPASGPYRCFPRSLPLRWSQCPCPLLTTVGFGLFLVILGANAPRRHAQSRGILSPTPHPQRTVCVWGLASGSFIVCVCVCCLCRCVSSFT